MPRWSLAEFERSSYTVLANLDAWEIAFEAYGHLSDS
jgi:hypothetical protein